MKILVWISLCVKFVFLGAYIYVIYKKKYRNNIKCNNTKHTYISLYANKENRALWKYDSGKL